MESVITAIIGHLYVVIGVLKNSLYKLDKNRVLTKYLKSLPNGNHLSCYIFKQIHCVISVIRYKPILSHFCEKAIMGNHLYFSSNSNLPFNTNTRCRLMSKYNYMFLMYTFCHNTDLSYFIHNEESFSFQG